MVLVSGSDWQQKLISGEDVVEDPYTAEYPVTKWDSATVVSDCPKCDCTATVQSINLTIAQLQKFSDYQETALGDIIAQLHSRIAAEGGSVYTGDRSTAVGNIASIYSTDAAVFDFWAGFQQIDRMFMTRAPGPEDTAMLQSQIKNIDRFSSLYKLDPAKISEWKQKINKWISSSMQPSGKKTVYFAPNIGEFGSGA